MGFALFRRQPTAKAVQEFLGRAIQMAGRQPKYLVTDHGRQFIARNFRRWCRRRGIRQRFGAIGRTRGSPRPLPTRCTTIVDQPAGHRASNHATAGHAARSAPHLRL
jgi:transposase InsO family protein